MVPTNRQPAIPGYQILTFDDYILILYSSNIICDSFFVTFGGSLFFFSHLTVSSSHCAVLTSHMIVLLSHLMVHLIFSHLMVLSLHCTVSTSHLIVLLSHLVVLLYFFMAVFYLYPNKKIVFGFKSMPHLRRIN